MNAFKLGLVAGVVGVFCWGFVAVAEEAPEVELKVGDAAPQFEGTDENGQS